MSRDSPMVTIGLPVAQEPIEYVRDAVRSVLNQTYQDWELIVVADGAPAKTIAYLRGISDSRIRLVAHSESRGLATRLNEIATDARGMYLARMDADDIMVTDRIERQLHILVERGVDLVAARSVIINEKREIVGESAIGPTEVARASMFRSNPFMHPTVFARTEWFRNHPYDQDLLRCQDKALWITSAVDTTHFRDATPALFYRVADNLNPAKYARSATFERRIVRMYGPAVIGRLNTLLINAESIVKQNIIRLASRFGRANKVTRRRFTEIDAKAREAWEAALDLSIAATDAEREASLSTEEENE